MDPQRAQTLEAAVRLNISRRRDRLKLDQADLATRMRHLGYEKWIRQTVGNVERAGGRKVSVDELFGLSLALETSMSTLLAPDSDAFPLVELPAGHSLPANAVSASAGSGMNEGWVRWEGTDPVWPSDQVVQHMAQGPDRFRQVRQQLDRSPRLRVASGNEQDQMTRDVQTLLLSQMESLGIDQSTIDDARQAMGLEPGEGDDAAAARLRDTLGPEGLKQLVLMAGMDDIEQQFEPYIEDEADAGASPQSVASEARQPVGSEKGDKG